MAKKMTDKRLAENRAPEPPDWALSSDGKEARVQMAWNRQVRDTASPRSRIFLPIDQAIHLVKIGHATWFVSNQDSGGEPDENQDTEV